MIPWWSTETAVWIGVIGGGGVGTLSGLLGALCGVLVPRGIGRRVLIPCFAGVAAIGLSALVAGIVAVSMGQPYAVYYPLLLCGLILSTVMGGLIPVLIRGYRRADARKMDAQDLRRG